MENHKIKTKLNVSILFSVWFRFSLVLLIGICFILPYIVSAQTAISPTLSVSPHTFEISLFPGETVIQKIRISNKSQAALPIKVKVTDFTTEEETGQMVFDEFSQDPSFASRFWFEIESPDFILDPGEREIVNFTISAPKEAEPGGHYSTMLFVPQLPSFYFEGRGPRTIPIIGVLFLLSVKTFSLEPEVEQKLEVVEFSIPREERITMLEPAFSVIQRTYQRLSASIISPVQAAQFLQINITKKPPSSFILRIRNKDIYHIKPSGKVLVYNAFGKKAAEAEVPRKTILPGKTRQFPVEFSPETPDQLKWLPAVISDFLAQNFFFGKYRAVLELEAKSPVVEGFFKPNFLTTLTFFSLPWKFWLLFIVSFVLLTIFIIKFRKRIKAALSILVKRSPINT